MQRTIFVVCYKHFSKSDSVENLSCFYPEIMTAFSRDGRAIPAEGHVSGIAGKENRVSRIPGGKDILQWT
jgi:hypothetical protein